MSTISFPSLILTTQTYKSFLQILYTQNYITPQKQKNNTIHYLYILIQKTAHNIRIAIYRKPTFTDTIIPYSSNHPTQHKYAVHYTRTNYIRKNIIGLGKPSVNPIQFLPNPTMENSKIPPPQKKKTYEKLTTINTQTKMGYIYLYW